MFTFFYVDLFKGYNMGKKLGLLILAYFLIFLDDCIDSSHKFLILLSVLVFDILCMEGQEWYWRFPIREFDKKDKGL